MQTIKNLGLFGNRNLRLTATTLTLPPTGGGDCHGYQMKLSDLKAGLNTGTVDTEICLQRKHCGYPEGGVESFDLGLQDFDNEEAVAHIGCCEFTQADWNRILRAAKIAKPRYGYKLLRAKAKAKAARA